MTFIGKLLVLVNLALCVIMAGWSLSLYTNRINWSDPEKKTGLLVELQKKIKEEMQGYPPTAVRWFNARQEVIVRETGLMADKTQSKVYAGLSADRVWYETMLQLPRYAATVAKPTLAVATDPNGQIVLDPNFFNRPKMIPAKGRDGKDLLSFEFYVKRDRELGEQLGIEYDKQLKAMAADLKSTEQMNGDGKERGLKQRLVDEWEKDITIVNEQAGIEAQLIFTSAQTQAIRDRSEQLKGRKEQLEKK